MTKFVVSLFAALLLLAGCSSQTPGDAQAGESPTGSEPSQTSVSDDSNSETAPPSSPSTQGDPQLPADDDMPARDRIVAALEAGEIDEPTSLLYRVWATFGDPALPEEFQGPPAPHDLAIFAQLADSLDELPAEVAKQVEPYLQRPSDPDSAFSATEAPGMRASTGALRDADGASPQRCTDGWQSMAERDDDPTFRVWVCRDIGDDTAVDAALGTVLEMVERHAGEMTRPSPDGMGAPVPDEPDADATNPGDELIDIYVLPHGWMAPPRGGNERVMDEMASAITMRAAPYDGSRSSSYILLGAHLLDYPVPLERAVVHEIFHVLQNANWAGIDQATAWAFEASAVWAETYYLSAMSADVHARLPVLQASPLSLTDSDFAHRYAAYPWFTFLYQQAGPYGVFGFWLVLGTHPVDGSAPAVAESLQAIVDIPTEFPEFAMRLLNADLPGNPIDPRLVDADPSFPDGQIPVLPPQEFTGDEVVLDHAGIPGLGYRYTRVAVSDPDGPGVPVSISSSMTTASGSEPTLDALVENPGGDYVRVNFAEDGAQVCVAGEILLVATNIALGIDDVTTGSVTLTRDGSTTCDPAVNEAPAGGRGPSSGAPPSSPPPTSTGSAASVDGGPESEFCVDFKAFSLQVGGIAHLTMLPYTTADVERIFGFAEPYLADLPDGAAEQIATLRAAADSAAGLSAAEAADILDTPAVRQASKSVDATYAMYCSG